MKRHNSFLFVIATSIVVAGAIANLKVRCDTQSTEENVSSEAIVSSDDSHYVDHGTNNAVDNSVESVPECVDPPAYTEEELEILAIIIYQEAGGDACSDDTRRKVGSVFLNRVNSPLFPDTFKEVATQKKQYGTLGTTGIKWPDRAVHAGEAHAVERAYRIAEELLVSGSILPENAIWQAAFPQGDGTYYHQDGLYFCYSEVN